MEMFLVRRIVWADDEQVLDGVYENLFFAGMEKQQIGVFMWISLSGVNQSSYHHQLADEWCIESWQHSYLRFQLCQLHGCEHWPRLSNWSSWKQYRFDRTLCDWAIVLVCWARLIWYLELPRKSKTRAAFIRYVKRNISSCTGVRNEGMV